MCTAGLAASWQAGLRSRAAMACERAKGCAEVCLTTQSCVAPHQATETKLATEQRARADAEAQLAAERARWEAELRGMQEQAKKSEEQWQARVSRALVAGSL